METYYIAETQNSGSIRKAEKIEAKNLSAAKRKTTMEQVYQGTTLSIFSNIDENGYGVDIITSKNTGFPNTSNWR
jgi:hypothetical protein